MSLQTRIKQIIFIFGAEITLQVYLFNFNTKSLLYKTLMGSRPPLLPNSLNRSLYILFKKDIPPVLGQAVIKNDFSYLFLKRGR